MTTGGAWPRSFWFMWHCSNSEGVTRRQLHVLVWCALAFSTCSGVAQNTPLISGGLGFFADRNAGANTYQPVLAPVIAAPLGSHLLIESRADLRGVVSDAGAPFTGQFFASLQYLQADYIVNPKVTVVAGKFLTPFGTYNERLTAIWIPYLQNAPLTFPIGTKTSASSDGAMLRGVAFSNAKMQVNYNGYFSAFSNKTQFKVARTAGTQAALYFPGSRLEIGASYQRFLQGVHNNSVGLHVWWLPPRSAFELRSEYVHGARSQGYWIETAYRFSHFGGPNSLVGRFQPAFRMQQTFRNQPNFPGQSDGLPGVDTQQLDFGFDYHLPRELRLNSSYARQFTPTKNKNIWDLSLTYRFLFPAWRGGK
jgi:hypothetical protein